MAERIYSYDPVYGADARLLILGTAPSVASLREGFFYAHPRNCFWPMLADILGEATPADIENKKQMLLRHRIALWDVVHSCERAGSLDSAIRQPEPNDIRGLLRDCPGIRKVLLNGGTAHVLFERLVGDVGVPRVKLPSTSPAYTIRYPAKRDAWAAEILERK